MTEQPGIRTWSSFSAGPHYDPDNVSFGPVIGCDEHVVEPGAGFDWHAHRTVLIVSWVRSGTLRHEDDTGAVLEVGADGVLVQSAGSGIRHRETNASSSAPLRFVQTTLLLDVAPNVELVDLPWQGEGVTVDVRAVPMPAGDSRRDGRTFAIGDGDRTFVLAW